MLLCRQTEVKTLENVVVVSLQMLLNQSAQAPRRMLRKSVAHCGSAWVGHGEGGEVRLEAFELSKLVSGDSLTRFLRNSSSGRRGWDQMVTSEHELC